MKPLLIVAALVGSLCAATCSRTDAVRTKTDADGTVRWFVLPERRFIR
ncbi:MAG TPA: hypothetical protein VKP65_10335 [Rhodothermales bacterium]|nr:hypothetical protein [Rhodothermales bacterium]